jgi:hypothetical protein
VNVIQQPVHRFTTQQYYELGELGFLNQRTELLEGIITDMEPIGPWHANIGDILPAFSTNTPVAGSEYGFSIPLI